MAISVQKVFEKFDADGSGCLEIEEVKKGIHVLLGVDIPASNFEKAMKRFDADKNGFLDIKEFGQLFDDLHASRKAYVDPPIVASRGSILGKDTKLPCQDAVLLIYTHKVVVYFVAFCIIANFAVNILEKQIDPDPKNLIYEGFWANADLTFNVIFLIELCFNMWSYGGPVRRFWASAWNVFDTIIVSVGVLTMVNVLGPPLDKLKLMRAFRVFRLFKRIASLNTIITALIKSIPGVINAFVVMLVFFFIYAILAVELFRDFGEGGTYTTYDPITGDNITIDAMSGRGYVLGIEYYGTFMRALFTLFQVMTGESWSEAVVRPLLVGMYDHATVPGIFFVSFIILTQIVLINVVVAVLLDNMNNSDDDAGEAGGGVDARLSMLEHKEVSDGLNAKLDRIISDLARLDKLMPKLDALDRTVINLNAQMAEVEVMTKLAPVTLTDPPMQAQDIKFEVEM